MGMFSARMYCQTSSSVQFESGNTRMLSPVRMRLFSTDHSSGRWFFGSHWPFESRGEKMRPFARDRSSPRRADRGVEGAGFEAVEQRLGLQQAAAALRADEKRLRPVGDRFLVGVDDQ